MLDPTSRIHFSCFSKEGMDHDSYCAKLTGSDWMAYLGFDKMHLVWKQAGVLKSSGPVSGRMQPARYQFDTFRLGSVLPQTSRIILSKTSPDPIWFWLTVSGFGQTDLVQKQAGVQESSSMLLASASQPIWTGCESDPECLLGGLPHQLPSAPPHPPTQYSHTHTHTHNLR